VLSALSDEEHGHELAAILRQGPPEGERLDRALRIVRSPGSLEPARAAVAAVVDRARQLGLRLPDGPASTALIALAEFLAARCGARQSP